MCGINQSMETISSSCYNGFHTVTSNKNETSCFICENINNL